MNEDKIKRINELYRKQKGEGLSPQEKKEQKMLREEYIQSIRNNMNQTLSNVSIQNPDGTVIPLRKKDVH